MAGLVREVWVYALARGGEEIPAIASGRMPWLGPCIVAEAAGLVGFAMGILGWLPGTRGRPGGGRANR